MNVTQGDRALTRVMALHALTYCERLFYLEEVEEIRVADQAVYAGRTLHVELEEGDGASWTELDLASEDLGLVGKVDAVRRRDGPLVPYEHKRGHSARGRAWESDRIQVGAYAMLIEASLNEPVPEGRVRYHGDNKTIRVPVDEGLRSAVRAAIDRANKLRASLDRPPVAANEHLCVRCSLAPVCLPEEERKADDDSYDAIRLFPARRERLTVHVVGHGARVGRSGAALKLKPDEGDEVEWPSEQVGELVLQGYAQISTQAVALCSEKGIGLSWMTMGGNVIGTFAPGVGAVQRRLRQYEALRQEENRLELARRLVLARASGQLAFLLRATRGGERSDGLKAAVACMKNALRRANSAADADTLRGHEGDAAKAYFSMLSGLLTSEVPDELRYTSRTRRPPRDRFNALLSYGYGLLMRQVLQSIVAVGLEPAFGFYHTPRSAAYPLALDVMELFRVPLWDVVVVGSLNRRQWDPAQDFAVTPAKVWLSESGRKKAISLFETRLQEVWRHPVVGYSLDYARLIELEIRLLEKEWNGQRGLFARFRPR